ncbi:Tyrosine-protein kinase receptor [Fasciola gigantica]|uniref:Tyrosine-protein kinase receptor n=1 Tax=Fasciola gigantica TaxID=46835 RepID=A0A504YR52_FASGI|nr:Tyrosine-protein kinase receptor [Fasciola gigantica]
MSEHNSRIFIVEYFARGTALVLCAAYRLGFYFDAGYVWFLNPWLSKDWWNSPEILPTQCTMSEMANITSWTFTLEHQVMRTVVYPYPRESLVTEPEVVNRVSRHVAEHSVADIPMDSDTQPMDSVDILEDHNYAVYTWESVIVLAKALVHLLRENPSAMSVFETVQVAEAYQRIVASTDIVYTSTPETFLPTREKAAHDGTSDLLGLSANDPAIQVSSRLRFNDQNERATDFWLLRQHRGPITASVIRWAVIPPTTTLLNGSVHADFGHERDEVPAMIGEAVLEPINWGRHHGPPGDGSQTEEHCAFLLASQLFGVSCSTATTICVIGMIALLAFPLFTVFIVYYRRKLKEAERLIRKPYEDLCEELVDIDIPSSDIVLNRRVGQGAFGMVYGGEAKRNGRWEAVAVKVIGGQATYKGKTGFLWEAKVMRSLDHKNVVRLIGICLRLKEDDLYLIMEVMLLGDLKTYLLSRRVLAQQFPDHDDIRPSTLTQMAIDIAEGVGYLHSKNLVHRDLACRNCLVGSDRVVKIGDFGLTRELITTKREGYYRSTRNCELPVRWMAPEALQFNVSSVQSDVWSYGIVLYEIITFGVFPYDGLSNFEVVERVKRKEFRILSFLPPAAQNTTIARLIDFCCQHQWQQRPESMERIVTMLRMNPECVRPFLTDEPPKLKITISELPFQPGAGACIMSEHALASDGPASNNPPSSMALVEGMSNNHVCSGRGFHSTTGSLAGIGRSSLAYCSTDSFSESTVAAARLIASEGIQQSAGRRRHKTAEGSVGLVRGHFLRRGTTSSSSGGHTCHGSEASSDDRSHGDLNQTKSSAALFTLTPLLTHGSVGSQPSPTRPTEPSVYTAMRKLGNGARRSTKQIGSSVTTRRGESMASPRHLLLHKPGSMDDELMELNSEHSKAKNKRASHDLPDLVKSSDSLMHRHPGGLNTNVTNGPVDTRISSIKEQTKQPNGVVSSTLRSLSAEYLSTEADRNNSGSGCTKSAPEGHSSAYARSFPLKVLAEASQIRPIIKSAIRPKNGSSSTPPGTAGHVGRGSDGYPWVSSPQTSSRSVVDNASHLFRSVIRAIWRNSNQNKQTGRSPPGGTLRITRSSTSCRALGAQDLSCISQSNLDVKTSNVSTSCPPLLMPQCSFVNSRLTDNPDGSEPSRVSGCIPPLSATPAERSFFPQLHNNSLDNFSITDPVPPTLVHRSTHASLNSLSQHPVVSSPNREMAETSLTSVVYTKLSDQVSPVLPPTPRPTPPSTDSPEPHRKPSYIDASPSDPFYLV